MPQLSPMMGILIWVLSSLTLLTILINLNQK